MTTHFQKKLTLPTSSQELFDWHTRFGAFQRLCPPWDPVTLIRQDPHIRDGAEVHLRVKAPPFGLPLTLKVRHQNYQEGIQFEDTQTQGPFASWTHTHRIESSSSATEDESGSKSESATLIDSIQYRLPLHPLGTWVGGGLIKARLKQLFHYRHTLMNHDFQLHHLAQGQSLKVAVSGSTGLIGKALCALLTTGGHEVYRLVRRPSSSPHTHRENKQGKELLWSTPDQVPDLSGIDAVIHLAGENIAQRWTASAKERIIHSRVHRTQALAKAIADEVQKRKESTQDQPDSFRPLTFISTSAIGYYGCQVPQEVDEEGALGSGFLAEVCQAWEEACLPAEIEGVRLVKMRVGIVLSLDGGALAKLITPFKLGVGGPVGQGKMWMSWIGLEDVVGAFYFALLNRDVQGIVNAVAPHPVQNREFSQTLASVLRRPCLFPAPPPMLKLVFGHMAEETILASQKVRPTRLQEWGYPFLHSTLREALQFELGKVPAV